MFWKHGHENACFLRFVLLFLDFQKCFVINRFETEKCFLFVFRKKKDSLEKKAKLYCSFIYCYDQSKNVNFICLQDDVNSWC